MMNHIHLLNLTSVGIFGMLLSAAFCDILWTWKKRLAMLGGMAVILAFQGAVYFFVDSALVESVYPFVTHVPLAVLLCVLNKKCLWPVISVLTAYLCCQLRRWLALLAVAVFSGGTLLQDAAELAATLPLLLLLLRFIAPSVRSVSHYAVLRQCQFGVVPALYYGFDYLTRVYTNLLLEGVLVAVEFMPFVCSAAYLFFVVRASKEQGIRDRLEQVQESLYLQVAQAVREMEALRESQRQTRIYRHDLRHHMRYLLSCLENGRIEQAQRHIREVCSEMEAYPVTIYCENEAANLIFSSFAGRLEKYHIAIKIMAQIPQDLHISESDLCILLSNALENALHACRELKEKGQPASIEVSAYEKKGKLFFQCINSCGKDIVFENGIPVTDHPGHGIGVRSICAIAERYGGIYAFLVHTGQFILRVSL